MNARRSPLLILLLIGIALAGPLIAYAGVTILHPKSTHTLQASGTPPLTFSQGEDYAAASAGGWASAFARQDQNASYTITLVALPGSNVTIDKYANITKAAAVASFKFSIATAMTGTLDATEVSIHKVRLWTGAVPPTTDASAGVCAVLDLEASSGTETSGSCSGATVFMQSVFRLGHDAAGTSTVSIRPTSVLYT